MRMKAEKISRLPITFPNMSHLSDPHAVESPTAQTAVLSQLGTSPPTYFWKASTWLAKPQMM